MAQAIQTRGKHCAATTREHPWNLLSGTGLKWVAIVTMIVDHLAGVLIYGHRPALAEMTGISADQWLTAYTVMREIGRISFPIFCFVLVEGFEHTHDRAQYALRLLLFALVSEIPYDLALKDEISFMSQLNVMFTLLLAFCALWLASGIAKALKLPAWGEDLVSVATIAGAAALAAGPVNVSYHAYGVLLVGALYVARRWRLVQVALGAALGVWFCLENNSWLQIWSVVGLACLVLYNGKRGRGMKYFFYLFYPLHLLILGLVKMWLY